MVSFILGHWNDILAVFGGLVGVCSSIVKIIPNTKAGSKISAFVNLCDHLSIAFTKTDKAILGK